jgi:hypothetical protein
MALRMSVCRKGTILAQCQLPHCWGKQRFSPATCKIRQPGKVEMKTRCSSASITCSSDTREHFDIRLKRPLGPGSAARGQRSGEPTSASWNTCGTTRISQSRSGCGWPLTPPAWNPQSDETFFLHASIGRSRCTTDSRILPASLLLAHAHLDPPESGSHANPPSAARACLRSLSSRYPMPFPTS